MKIRELIEKLSEIEKKQGDIVVIYIDSEYGDEEILEVTTNVLNDKSVVAIIK